MAIQHIPILICPVQDSDLPGVLAVYCQSQDFLALGPAPIASEEMVHRDIECSRQAGGLFCGIFRPGGNLIGVIDFVPENFEGCPQQAFIALLMIAAPYRRCGIGQRVLAHVENGIQKTGHANKIITVVQADITIIYRLRKDI